MGAMSSTRVLLLHGVEHRRPPSHWLWSLAEDLRRERIPVQYPQLPGPDAPLLEEWLDVARAEFAMLGEGDRVVITHSLGCLLWAHLAPTLDLGNAALRVLMVAPPSDSILWEPIAHFAGAGAVPPGRLAPTAVVGRSVDPYRPTPLAELASAWEAAAIELEGTGHLTPDDGHGRWEAPLAWVLGGSATWEPNRLG